MSTTSVDLQGLQATLAALRNLKVSVQRKYARKGVTKAARVMAKAAKQLAPRESGALKKSIAFRVFTYKDKSGVGAVIGPARNVTKPKGWGTKAVRFAITRTKRGKAKIASKKAIAAGGISEYRTPANYAHLVEFGRNAIRAGKASRRGTIGRIARKLGSKGILGFRNTGKRVLANAATGQIFGTEVQAAKPKPFMRPAYDSTKGRCMQIIADELAAGIKAEAVKRGSSWPT